MNAQEPLSVKRLEQIRGQIPWQQIAWHEAAALLGEVDRLRAKLERYEIREHVTRVLAHPEHANQFSLLVT